MSRNHSFGLRWIAAIVLASCTTDAPQQDRRLAQQDTLYDALSDGAATAARQAVQEALESRLSNETTPWQDGSGSSGSVTPLRTFRIKTGHYCRDYAETVVKDVQRVLVVRTACRDRQGIWRIVEL